MDDWVICKKEEEDWELLEILPTTSTGTKEWLLWSGTWKSRYIPNVWGEIETLLINKPKDTDRFYQVGAFVSSKGIIKQDPEYVPICIQVHEDGEHLTIYGNHLGYEVIGSAKLKGENKIKGRYRCRSTGDAGSFKLKLQR